MRTLDAIKKGEYVAPSGATVLIDVSDCVNSTKFYSPQALERFVIDAATAPDVQTSIELVNETSLQGAIRLVSAKSYSRVGVLNFASARNPGGGFLNGAASQEESLARSSALYPSLQAAPQYYDIHRSSNAAYTDAMIVSPDCLVFVDDEGTFLENPYVVDFITSAAPNAGVLASREGLNDIIEVRAAKVLGLALHRGIDALVLGAWGCGVFRNNPTTVALIFKELLEGPFKNKFSKVLFSVYDPYRDLRIFNSFRAAFPISEDDDPGEEAYREHTQIY